MRKIGFYEKGADGSQADQRLDQQERNYLLRYDSGRTVTFADALLHTIIFGTTGTGKTTNAMLPMLMKYFEEGIGGLIIDIKGNMRGKIRSLIRKAGRENDIVEYGAEDSATPSNIVSNMDEASFYEFCVKLLEDSFNGQTANMDFHVKGAGMARDCFMLMRFLEERFPEFEPNLKTIQEMFNDPVNASELFLFFEKYVAQPENREHQRFINEVRNYQFHVLNQSAEKLKHSGSTHHEQMSYNTSAMKNALRAFMDVRGVQEKLCAHRAAPIDMVDHIQNNRVVVMRFGPDAGRVGAHLSRVIINAYYAATYKKDTSTMRQNFVCIDEFQEVADLSGDRFSDTNFIALAREFGCGFSAATQSESSMLNCGKSQAAVESFISNCNTKIFFYSDDPFTREIAKRYDPDLDLIHLKPGQAFTVGYDAASREHSWSMDSLQDSYESLKDMKPLEIVATTADCMARPDLIQLLVEASAHKKELQTRMENSNPESSSGRKYYDPASRSTRPGEKGVKNMEPGIMPDWIKVAWADLFTENAIVSVPNGWRKTVENALALYRELNFGIRISNLGLNRDRNLVAMGERRNCELDVLNDLLAPTRDICMNCGNELSPEQKRARKDADENTLRVDWLIDEDDQEEDEEVVEETYGLHLPICMKCLERHSLKKDRNKI